MLSLTRAACAASLLTALLCPAAPAVPLAVKAAPVVVNAASIAVKAVPTAAIAVDATSDMAYTGVLLDARALPAILRSPAPSIVGPGPDWTLIYPDRSHVPTPDEVQDESIVRYYHTEVEAAQGIGGSHPLVIPAAAVIGYAHDGLQVTAADMQRLLEVEKSLHFTQNWRVGFLIPADH